MRTARPTVFNIYGIQDSSTRKIPTFQAGLPPSIACVGPMILRSLERGYPMADSSRKTAKNSTTKKSSTRNTGAQPRGTAAASPGTPTGFRVRAYQVGFGDCFLLTFEYPSGNKHVLIDFGTVRLPDNAPRDQLMKIAQDIKQVCGSEGLTAVVETHRHRDHISGFS